MKKNFLLSSILIVTLATLFNSCSKDGGTSSKVYSRVGISRLTILSYPQTLPYGDDWDDALTGVYPDIYFRITKSGTIAALYALPTSSRKENLRVVDLPFSWSQNSGGTFFTHNDLNQAIDIDLYDYDSTTSDEYIGTVTVDFNDYITGSSKYPGTITKTLGSVSVKLELAWLE